MSTVEIVRIEIQVYTRKGNTWKTRPSWALEIDGKVVSKHPRKATLVALAERLVKESDHAQD